MVGMDGCFYFIENITPYAPVSNHELKQWQEIMQMLG